MVRNSFKFPRKTRGKKRVLPHRNTAINYTIECGMHCNVLSLSDLKIEINYCIPFNNYAKKLVKTEIVSHNSTYSQLKRQNKVERMEFYYD